MKLVDDHRQEAAAGEAGEIAIRGHNVMKGYWNRPEATAEAIDSDGWFYSGDIAQVDDDGCYFIVDRKKELIIRGGYNVYPREIEEVLYEHPAVREAAVIGIPHAELGEEVAAAVALRAGAEVTSPRSATTSRPTSPRTSTRGGSGSSRSCPRDRPARSSSARSSRRRGWVRSRSRRSSNGCGRTHAPRRSGGRFPMTRSPVREIVSCHKSTPRGRSNNVKSTENSRAAGDQYRRRRVPLVRVDANFNLHWFTVADGVFGKFGLPEKFQLVLPATFVTWGLYYVLGANRVALRTTLIAATTGTIGAIVIMTLGPALAGLPSLGHLPRDRDRWRRPGDPLSLSPTTSWRRPPRSFARRRSCSGGLPPVSTTTSRAQPARTRSPHSASR